MASLCCCWRSLRRQPGDVRPAIVRFWVDGQPLTRSPARLRSLSVVDRPSRSLMSVSDTASIDFVNSLRNSSTTSSVVRDGGHAHESGQLSVRTIDQYPRWHEDQQTLAIRLIDRVEDDAHVAADQACRASAGL